MMLRSFSLLLIMVFATLNVKAQLVDESLIKSENQSIRFQLLNKKSVANDDYDILYHRIYLNINPAKTQMSGAVFSRFKVQIDDLNTIKFDFIKELQIDSIIYHNQKLNYSLSSVQLAIPLPQNLVKNSIDSIMVYYSGEPSKFTNRSYTREKARPKNPAPVVYTLSEPYGARDWWPCKQSLDDKIDSLDLFITVPKGNKAASNGNLESEIQLNDSQVLFHWKHRYPIVTYLVAVAITNYEEFSDWVHFKNGDSIEILNYWYPESVAIERERAKRTVDMMVLFDSLFGEYPFMNEKYGHAQFGFAGGMEHQTMSFMADLNFGLVAHELAHQWFGNQVTCGSWQDLWLNESFATYLTLMAYEFLESDSAWKSQLQNTANNVKSKNDGSVWVYASDTSNVSRLFSGRLTYRKGAYVLHMLRWKLGDEVFFKAVRRYLTEPNITYEFATTKDFQQIFEEESGEDLSGFFDQWIYREGFPIYNVVWKTENNLQHIEIKQSTSHASVDFFEIPIPLRFSNGQYDTTIVINQEKNNSQHIIKLPFKPELLEFDPELKLLARHNIFRDQSGENKVTIYPNPGNGTIQILYAPYIINKIEVYDMLGHLCLQKDIALRGVAETSLDVSSLIAGCYTIKVIGEGYSFTDLFIKSQKH